VKIETNDYLAINETILIVDDEKSVLDLTSEMLERNGYKSIMAGSGESAIEIYKRERDQIDIVFLDVEMSGMGGHRCFEELLRINPEIKIVISTGCSPIGKIKEMLDAGAAGYIGKPYRPSDMVKKVREILDKKAGF